MAQKLFALEDAELAGTEVELEVSPEVGETADVETEVAPEVAEVAEIETGVEEGMGAADQLENVEEVVEQAAEGEGLDPVAAEAIKIAVEAICSRIGANPKAVYSLYATENFQSASSRKANTKYALEGVSEFLKDLWKKIKGALQKLWAKVKDFWAKHVSNLGRVKKALESMKAKVAQSSGKVEKAYIEEAPSGLVAAFASKGDLTSDVVSKCIAAHMTAGKAVAAAVASGAAASSAAIDSVKAKAAAQLGKATGTWNLGTEADPLVGGVYITYDVKAEDDELVVEVTRETAEKGEKGGLNVPGKDKVGALIKDTLDLITEDVKAKAAFDKAEAEFNKTMVEIEKELNATVSDQASSEAAKEVRKSLKIVYKANAKVPQITAEKVSLDVKLAKAVMGFAAVCLKNYK